MTFIRKFALTKRTIRAWFVALRCWVCAKRPRYSFPIEHTNSAVAHVYSLMSKQTIVLQYGSDAASLTVAEQYVSAFGNLAKEGNTILLPSNTGEVSNMVAQVCRKAYSEHVIITFFIRNTVHTF